MLTAARHGQRFDRGDGSTPVFVHPARLRAELVREARLYEAGLMRADGAAVEMSEEAEAGAILEAETACDVREIAEIARAWRDANQNNGGGG